MHAAKLGASAVLSSLLLSGCVDTELCVPVETRFAFFSQGDCVLTRAGFFQGHEWLTYFANADLDATDRFTDEETRQIAEGNRRIDWPKELLVHMNASVLSYANALTDYTNRPENQRLHFLLTDKNGSEEAVQDSVEEIRDVSIEAIELWNFNRDRALTLIGRANHIVQDSFSAAHAARDVERSWCIIKVKAYIPRAQGFLTPDVEFHGGNDGDTIGHTTTEDSIYRAGRDCHEPDGAARVEACLSETAQRGRLATRDYLRLVREATARYVADQGEAADPGEVLDEAFEAFVVDHFSFCP
ncbi:MAG TPA: hypothetical protein VF989_02185 [Polyangiaceae bacterium]